MYVSWDGIFAHGMGHTTKMATIPIYGKTITKNLLNQRANYDQIPGSFTERAEVPEWTLHVPPEYFFLYSFRTEGLKVATESDYREICCLGTGKTDSRRWGGRLLLQCQDFIKLCKQLSTCIHYSIHLPCILETFHSVHSKCITSTQSHI